MSHFVIIDRLADIILRSAKGSVVEIGMGGSSHIMAKHANQAKVPYFSCDISPKFRGDMDKGHIHFPGKSEDFIKQFSGTPPALVLLDGCHEYEVVKMEFDFFLPKLVPGGVIFLHDTLPPKPQFVALNRCGTVYKLRHEIEERKDIEVFTWPYTAMNCGLTMVQKKPVCCVDGEK